LTKKKADVGDLADLLVVLRDSYQSTVTAIDEFLNKCAIEQTAPEKNESAKTSVPKFDAKDYDSLPWQKFENKRKQIWERFSTAEDCGDRNKFKQDLIDCCMNPEATINAPMITYDYGYWIFKDWLYRRPMKTPK